MRCFTHFLQNMTTLASGLLLDYQIDTVRRAERACRGFVTIDGSEKLSLFNAMKRGLVVESRGLRSV